MEFLKKGEMITNNQGVSYYQIGKNYFSNSGWLEREITKDEFDAKVKEAFKQLRKE